MKKNTEPKPLHLPDVTKRARVLNWVVLRLFGWHPIEKRDPEGNPQWSKQVSPRLKRTGPVSYAFRHLRG